MSSSSTRIEQLLKSIIKETVDNEYENEYRDMLTDLENQVKAIYPESSIKSLEELKSFLKEAIPVMVLTDLVRCKSLKVCSGISPGFTELANKRGFMTVTKSVPGHFYNIVFTDSGPVKVDLSHVQFERATHYDDEEGQEEVNRLLKKVTLNPFSAVKISLLGKGVSNLVGISLPRGEAELHFAFDPIGSYDRGKKILQNILNNREEYSRKHKDDDFADPADYGQEMNPDVVPFLKRL